MSSCTPGARKSNATAGMRGACITFVALWLIAITCLLATALPAMAQQAREPLFRPNRHAVAVVIGNRNYQRAKIPVEYAHNDAQAIRDWLIRLGFRRNNIIFVKDATKVTLEEIFGTADYPCGQLCEMVRRGRSDVFVYYSGHGVPDEKGREAYLLPVDVAPERPRLGYPVKLLMRNLERVAQKVGPRRKVMVMLEACFSGESGGGTLLPVSAPGFGPPLPRSENIIRISAAARDQAATWDRELKLGLMTGRFLAGAAGLADTEEFGGDGNGRVSWQELRNYVTAEVAQVARERYGRAQTPEFTPASLSLALRPVTVEAVQPLLSHWRDEAAWNRTREKNTRLAYEEYLATCKRNGMCAHKKKAQRYIQNFHCQSVKQEDDEAWQYASRNDTVEAYKYYLSKCEGLRKRCERQACAYENLAKKYYMQKNLSKRNRGKSKSGRIKLIYDRIGHKSRPNIKKKRGEIYINKNRQSLKKILSRGSKNNKDVKFVRLAKDWQLIPQIGHSKGIYAVAFSPSDRLVASGSADKTIRIWDVKAGQLLRILEKSRGWIVAIAFSPNGRYLVSGSMDGRIRVWEIKTGKLRHNFLGSKGGVYSVAYSPNGHYLAAGGTDKKVRIWDAKKWKILNTFHHENVVKSISFSPDSRYIIAGGDGGRVPIWDVQSGQILNTLEFEKGYRVKSVVYSPNSHNVAVGYGKMDRPPYFTVEMRDVKANRLLWVLQGSNAGIRSLAFSPDGNFLAVSRDSPGIMGSVFGLGKIVVRDSRNGHPIRTLKRHRGSVTSISFSRNGQYIASGSVDKTLKIWSANTDQLLHTFQGRERSIGSVFCLRDGRRIYIEVSSKYIVNIDVFSGRNSKKRIKTPISSEKAGCNNIKIMESRIDFIDKKSNRVIRSLSILPKGNWVFWAPWGPYTASPGAHKYLLLVERNGLKARPVTEAWRKAFFRPNGFKPQDLAPPKEFLARK